MNDTHFRLGELFSGPGGLGLAASHASQAVDGVSVSHAWATDYDEDTCSTYLSNVLLNDNKGTPAPADQVYKGQPHPGDAPLVYCADITKLKTDLLPAIDALAFGAPCFGAGTPVITRRGALPIEEVKIGDEVWTHRGRWRKVEATMSREAEMVQVGPVITTPDHPFYARSAENRWDPGQRRRVRHLSEPRWVRAEGLKGHLAASPLSVDAPALNFQVDPWLAGRYVADGWTSKSGVSFAVGTGKEREFEETTSGIDMWVSKTGPNCTRYTWNDHSAAEWLYETFGKYAHEKTIPLGVLSAPRNVREEFFWGYMAGDGYKHRKQGGGRFVTTSENIASQMRLLAISLGYTTWAYRVNPPATAEIEGRTVNQRQRWEVGVTKSDGRYTEDIDGLHWFQIRKDPKQLGRGTVYDLTVEEDHSFTAWGYVVHNCNDFSAAGKRKGVDGKFGPLYSYGVNVLRSHRPSWFLFENVGGIRSNGLDIVMDDFEAAGYRLYPHYYRFEEYGVPQTRHRLIIIGIRDDLDVKFKIPAPFEADVSSATALAGIPEWATHNEPPRMGKTSVERLEHIKPGQNAWTADLPEHLKITNKTQMSIFWRRLHPEKPSPTITASGGGGTHGYHFDEPRALTNRERARIQTFPDDFTFTGKKESVRKQIGMAVPPAGVQVIFEAVLKSFTGEEYDWVESNMPRNRPGIPDSSTVQG